MSGKMTVNRVIGLLVLVSSFAVGWLIMDLRDFMQTPLQVKLPDDGRTYQRYTLEPGQNLTVVARQLYEAGIIDHPRYLLWMARWQGSADRIKAGEYALTPDITVQQLLDMISRGDVIQYPATIIEGWTYHQLQHYLNGIDGIEHHPAALRTQDIMTALGYSEASPEGLFLPDTYYYTRGMSDLQILRRAYEAMTQLLQQAWKQRAPNLPYESPYEALIMASIIEKETAVASERGQIAGVFVRRLQKHMRLQTDPTVIYGIGEAFDGNLRSRDLHTDTPYNTYRHYGLPPTPIAMPGSESIRAALHPEEGDTLYFVARGDGTHQFSATIAEHNKAVRKYQLK
jgi:UPF0755 protein